MSFHVVTPSCDRLRACFPDFSSQWLFQLQRFVEIDPILTELLRDQLFSFSCGANPKYLVPTREVDTPNRFLFAFFFHTGATIRVNHLDVFFPCGHE